MDWNSGLLQRWWGLCTWYAPLWAPNFETLLSNQGQKINNKNNCNLSIMLHLYIQTLNSPHLQQRNKLSLNGVITVSVLLIVIMLISLASFLFSSTSHCCPTLFQGWSDVCKRDSQWKRWVLHLTCLTGRQQYVSGKWCVLCVYCSLVYIT